MLVSNLPPYLVPAPIRSRVTGHIQTMAFVQYRKGDRIVELALCENFVGERTNNGSAWTRWSDKVCDDHAAAIKWITDQSELYVRRGFRSRTTSGLLLPLNETDVRNMRKWSTLSRAALDFGSKMLTDIETWAKTETALVATVGPMSVAPLAPPALPTTTPIPPSGAGAATRAGSSSGATAEELARRLKDAVDGLGDIKSAGF